MFSEPILEQDLMAPVGHDANDLKMLPPILVAGYGRSGTVAVMKILATDPAVVFDREYPYGSVTMAGKMLTGYLSFGSCSAATQRLPISERNSMPKRLRCG
jgi:hypothetical protein